MEFPVKTHCLLFPLSLLSSSPRLSPSFVLSSHSHWHVISLTTADINHSAWIDSVWQTADGWRCSSTDTWLKEGGEREGGDRERGEMCVRVWGECVYYSGGGMWHSHPSINSTALFLSTLVWRKAGIQKSWGGLDRWSPGRTHTHTGGGGGGGGVFIISNKYSVNVL